MGDNKKMNPGIGMGIAIGTALSAAKSVMESKQYLVEGAKLICVNGSEITQLKIPASHNYTSGGKIKANCKDCKVCENIPYFGECLKNEDDHKCEGFMELSEVWENTAVSATKAENVSGEDAISLSSVLLCKKGGLIIPVTSGQGYDGKIDWDSFFKRYQNVIHWAAGKSLLCQVFGKDPINMNTGNYVYEKEDLIVRGGMPLSFHLFYNAMGGVEQGNLGDGWSTNYGVYLKKEFGDKLLSLILEDGHCAPYGQGPDGEYISVMGDGGAIIKSNTGYLYEHEQGIIYEFDHDGKMVKQRDKNGNFRVFIYENGFLKKVKNSSGAWLYYIYNDEKKLIYVDDHTGRRVCLRYQYGKLRRYIDSGNNTYIYEYNENGKLAEVITPRNIIGVKNEYDGADRVIKQTMPDGSIVEMRYDDKLKRTYVKEENGNLIIYENDGKMRNIRTIFEDGQETFTYNDRNQKIRYQDKNGNTSHYAYDNRGNLTQIINALGYKLNLTYDSMENLTSIKWPDNSCVKNYYDNLGNLVKKIDQNGNIIKISYKEGLPKRLVLPDNSEIHMAYDDRGNMNYIEDFFGNEIEYEYDELNRLIKIKDRNAHITKFIYDSRDNLIEIENALGEKRNFIYEHDLLIKITDFNGTTEEMEYDQRNHISKYTDANGSSSLFEYDNMGNLTKEILPNGGIQQYKYNKLNQLEYTINLFGGKTEYKYDKNGNIIETISPNGGKTKMEYDAINRIISIKDADGIVTKYWYTPIGKIKEMEDGLGRKTQFEYDKCGNLIKKIDPIGNETTLSYNVFNKVKEINKSIGEKITYSYEKGGQLAEVIYSNGRKTKYQYDPEGYVTGITNENGNTLGFYYDELNRITKTISSEGAENSFFYDKADHIISVIDANKNRYKYDYTAAGDLKKMVDAMGNITRYTYDQEGNILSVLRSDKTDLDLEKIGFFKAAEMGLRFSKYERNEMGQIIKSVDSIGNTDEFKYDKEGTLIHRIDREGNLTQLSYTAGGDIQSIQYSDGNTVNYTYNSLKQLTEMKDWLGSTKFDYDNLGILQSITDHKGRKVKYEWDALGRSKAITYPDDMTVRYLYDQDKNLIRVLSDTGNIDYAYDQKGRLVRSESSNGVSTEYQYDTLNRQTRLTHYKYEEILDEYQYKYDLIGNKKRIKKYRKDIPVDTGTFDYEYDPLNRLIRVIKDNKEICRYEYDSYGNRTYKNERGEEATYRYDSLDRLIKDHDDQSIREYTYDLRGNLSKVICNGEDSYNYEFGADNRLKTCRGPLGKVAYIYNGLGLRVKKKEEVGVYDENQIDYIMDQTKLYDNLLQKIENGASHDYIWDKALLFEKTKGNNLNYLTDELGSPIRIFENNACRGNLYRYHTFGKAVKEKGVYDQAFNYAGFTEDKFSGTYFVQGREYLPSCGRFISEDPLPGMAFYPLSINRYLYCNDDPINSTDKSGLIAPIILAFGAAALAGGAANVIGQGIADVITSVAEGEVHISSLQTYTGAFVGGALGGMSAIPAAATGPFAPFISGFVTGATTSLATDALNKVTGADEDKTAGDIFGDALFYGTMAGGLGKLSEVLRLDKLIKIPGITAGRNSFMAIFRNKMTKFGHGTYERISPKTIFKMITANTIGNTVNNFLFGVGSYLKGKMGDIGDFITAKWDEFTQWGARKLYDIQDAYLRWYWSVTGGQCFN